MARGSARLRGLWRPLVLPLLFALALAACAAPSGAPLALVELYRPSTVLTSVPVTITADGRVLGTLRNGERMSCRLALPVELRTLEEPDILLGRSLRVASGPARVRVYVELSSATLTRAAFRLRYVADLAFADPSEQETYSAERTDAWREVPCAS
ncbi:MAG TPA: hypothetical protein VFR34_00200 [Paracoccaceae bacterium]|nr:hypothetical protein [Paracoccaceae bacterium]